MATLVFDLPFPPSLNSLFPTNRKTGRRFVSKKYEAWRKEAYWLIGLKKVETLKNPVIISISLGAPDKRSRDGDNFLKALKDSLVVMRVIQDDSNKFVKETRVDWNGPQGRAKVTIVEIDK